MGAHHSGSCKFQQRCSHAVLSNRADLFAVSFNSGRPKPKDNQAVNNVHGIHSDASAIVQAAGSILDSAAIVPSTTGNTLAIK